jgi:uncharacterized sulfatase
MPNQKVILIMVDTQRYDMLGCYGRNPDMKTPNLDRLSAEGMRFERAYTCQPVCGPARAAMFTGTFPHSNGSWGNSMPLGANVKTIGQRLQDQGVHTAYIGKWHLDGGDYFGLGRCPEGWDPDYWYDMRNYLEELSPEERVKSRRAATNREWDVPDEFTFGHRCSNRACDFLEKHGEEDFFLTVSYDEPHGPCLCPQRFWKPYEDYEFPKRGNVWDTLEGKPEHQHAWAGEGWADCDKEALKLKSAFYFGCNTFVDHEIGRVLESVDRHAPDALVIYTADHGSAMRSHGLTGKGPCVYDEVARVPFIVRCPAMIPRVSVCDAPTSHIDIAPTIMEFLGKPLPTLLEGKSMLPVLKDPTTQINEAIFIEFMRYEIDHDGFGGLQPMRATFDGRYKLCINLLSSDELYDMRKDPDEMQNLIESTEHAAIRDGLHDRILDWMNETRDPFRGYVWERRPWRKDARPATWDYTLMTRQRENEEYEPRQLDYGTGLDMEDAVREKG